MTNQFRPKTRRQTLHKGIQLLIAEISYQYLSLKSQICSWRYKCPSQLVVSGTLWTDIFLGYKKNKQVNLAASTNLKNLRGITIISYEVFFPLFFISRRLITLQYCSGFCHTLTWISHGFTGVPHPEPTPTSLLIPSLWVIPLHQPWALVSCIQPGLVICFTLDNIHVSMLFSQIIPPLPSPIESKSLFYTSVSLFLSCI